MKKLNYLFIILVLFSSSCRNGEIKPVVVEVVRVKVTKVKSGEISIPVHANGMLVSSEELKLSFKIGGIVAKTFVVEGERVKKGDLLASLNLIEISANVNQARNGYEKALRDFNRAENLYRDSVATLEQKQNAATALEVARSTLDITQFNLSHSKIFAPDNGLILRKLVKENELVSSGYPVFLFGSDGKYWKIKSGLADKDIIKINRGDSAIVTFDAYPGIKFPAIVDQLGEISNPYTGTFEIELLLNNTDYRLASGFVASVELFPAGRSIYTMIPVASIVDADGQSGYVYIVSDKWRAQKMRVEIETIIGSMAAVKGFPDEITEVVSEGAAYLKEGMEVEVVK